MGQVEVRPDAGVLALLRGEGAGPAVAVRFAQCPNPEVADRLAASGAGWLTAGEWGRVEHPHSGFVRKTETCDGRRALRTTLYAPEGKLHELRDAESGEVLESFVRRVNDFKALRSHLKDLCQLPAARMPNLCAVGAPPLREMQARWAAPAILKTSQEAGDENWASCLRKLERLFRHRCEQAARAGATALLLGDGLPQGAAEDWLAALDTQLDWLNRHVGMPLYVAMKQWDDGLALGLAQRNVGVHLSATALTALADMGGWEGRLILELALDDLGDLEGSVKLLRQCPRALLLVAGEPVQQEEMEWLARLSGNTQGD